MKTITSLAIATTLGFGMSHAALVAHYTFDETTGNAANSAPGGANPGIVGSNVGRGVAGKFGNAFSFTGGLTSNDIVSMGNASSLASIMTAQKATVSVWMNWTANGHVRHAAVSLADNTYNDRWFAVGTTGGGSSTQVGGVYGRNSRVPTPTVNAGTDLNNGQWHHVAFTWGATTGVELYIDGVSQGTSSSAADILSLNVLEVGRLGRLTPADGFVGSVDELKIYDEVLNSSQIAALTVPEPGALALVGLGAFGLILRRRR